MVIGFTIAKMLWKGEKKKRKEKCLSTGDGLEAGAVNGAQRKNPANATNRQYFGDMNVGSNPFSRRRDSFETVISMGLSFALGKDPWARKLDQEARLALVDVS